MKTLCVCVCVCVCERERERERGGGGGGGLSQCLSVDLCAYMCLSVCRLTVRILCTVILSLHGHQNSVVYCATDP